MTANAPQSARGRKKVCITVSDAARAALAEVPSGWRSQWVDEAILEKRAKERMT